MGPDQVINERSRYDGGQRTGLVWKIYIKRSVSLFMTTVYRTFVTKVWADYKLNVKYFTVLLLSAA